MNSCEIIIPIIATIFGGIITGVAAYYTFIKSSRELKQETKELRNLLSALIILEQNETGQFKVVVDGEKKLVSVIGLMKGSSHGKSTVTNIVSKQSLK